MITNEKSALAEQLEKAFANDEYNQRLQQEIDEQKKLHEAGLEAIKNNSLEQIFTSFRDGDTWATYNLGLMHMNGIKVNKDLEKALQFFQLAHERKHALAKNMIQQVQNKIDQEKELITITPAQEVKADKKDKKVND